MESGLSHIQTQEIHRVVAPLAAADPVEEHGRPGAASSDRTFLIDKS